MEHIFNNLLTYLFDNNGINIIRWYLILIIIDIILGTVKSAINSHLKSRDYLKGIIIKLLSIFLIIVANAMDDIFNNYMHLKIGIDISDTYACCLFCYEVISIIENMNQMHVFTGKLQQIIQNIFNKNDL